MQRSARPRTALVAGLLALITAFGVVAATHHDAAPQDGRLATPAAVTVHTIADGPDDNTWGP